MGAGAIPLAFAAGIVSILSPCVLPILPIVLGAAASEHRFGPAALAAGLAISFVVIGLFAATIGYAIGLDLGAFRIVAAILMIAVGAILLLPRLQAQLAVAGAPVANWGSRHAGAAQQRGLGGQFAVGVLLGAVWSPCVGPTLGAAALLAAQERHLPLVAMTMFAFGLGAALPLFALGLLFRQSLTRWRDRLFSAGQGARMALGALFVVVGLLVLSGLDKAIETALVNASPQWLTELTTRF